MPSPVFWAKDSKSFFYVSKKNSKNIVWQQILEAEKPETFADLGDEDITDFAFSPDGKTLAYIRGKWEHDAFLIEGLR